MIIRQSFSDIFWFTLFHEDGQLLNEDFSNQYIDYSFIESEIEKKADLFARNVLVSDVAYKEFIYQFLFFDLLEIYFIPFSFHVIMRKILEVSYG